MKIGRRRSAGVEKRKRTTVMGTSMEVHIVLMRRNVRDGPMAAT